MGRDTASPDRLRCNLDEVAMSVEFPAQPLSGYWKRALDIILATCLIIVCAPMMLAIALLIRLDGGPAFYLHTRIGRGGIPFGCLKFRSMVVNAEAVLARHLAAHPDRAREWEEKRKLTHDPRVTAIGRVLRATSLDELPQLFNVLSGEMSLVGPRPVLEEELNRYYCHRSRAAYVSVRPGITGLWQVTGRSNTSYAERVALDLQYVERQSLLGDLHLLLRTIPAVLQKRGAM